MESDVRPPEAHTSQWGGTLEHWVTRDRPRSPPRRRGQRKGAPKGGPEEGAIAGKRTGGRVSQERGGVPRTPAPGRGRGVSWAGAAPSPRGRGRAVNPSHGRRGGRLTCGEGFYEETEAGLHGPKAEGGGRPRIRFTRRGPRRPLRRSRNLEGRAGCGDEEAHATSIPVGSGAVKRRFRLERRKLTLGGATPAPSSPLRVGKKWRAEGRDGSPGGGAWSEVRPAQWPLGRRGNGPGAGRGGAWRESAPAH